MTSPGTVWLVERLRAGRMQATPAGRLRELEDQRREARDAGDDERAADVDREIDQLFTEVREQERAEREASGASMRFSSGTRRALRQKPSPSAQMNQLILRRWRGL